MTYQRIEAFPDNAASYGSSELTALATVWREKQDELQETGVFQDFLKKLQREWAIETGIIERLYTWDRGVGRTGHPCFLVAWEHRFDAHTETKR